MEIRKIGLMKFSTISAGDVFIHDDMYYLKCDDGVQAVNLFSGSFNTFENDDEVIYQNAWLYVGGATI